MATFPGTSGNDRLPPPGTDSSGDDTLFGLAGDDTLDGGAGHDTLDGGIGADRMYGRTGNDTYNVDNVGDVVSENLVSGGGDDSVLSMISHTLRPNIERLYLGGIGSLNGTGNSLRNAIFGNDGANSLKGLGDNDHLDGRGGNDTLQGGAGADTLVGDTGVDTASYATSTTSVDVRLTQTTQASVSNGDAEGDQLNGIENLTGSAYGDGLGGDAGANTLSGGGGNDTLNGHAGADRLIGGPGVDTVEYVDDIGSGAAVNVDLATGRGSGGDAAGDILKSIENVRGTPENDVLTGNEAANYLGGGPRDDTLTGAGGADTLSGGTGSEDRFDIIRYQDTADSNTTTGVDVLQEFNRFQDRIDLSAIDANTAMAGNQGFSFATGATVPSTGVVTYDPDGWVYAANDAVAGWDLVIRTDANLGLGGSDFIL